jgi:hypothetical protein
MNRIRRGIKHEILFLKKVRHNPQVIRRRWRRVTSTRTSFVERNHDTANTLMLASSGRSGSTWLAEVIVETFSCRMIFEPLRRDSVRLSAKVLWGAYAEPDNVDPVMARVMQRVLSGRIRNQWTDQYNRFRLPRRRLVKEIRATNLLPWLHFQYPEMPIVYLLRHPVAVGWSAAELGWDPVLEEFQEHKLLMEGPLAPWREVIAREGADGDLFHRHVLRWCMENIVPMTQLAPGSVHVVFYEDLVVDPYGELRRLAGYLGRFQGGAWAFDPAPQPTVDRLSKSNFRKTPLMPAEERLQSWVGHVPQSSVDRAVALVAEFGLDRLYGASVRPRLTADEVLLGPPETPAGQSREGPITQGERPGPSGGTESSNSR